VRKRLRSFLSTLSYELEQSKEYFLEQSLNMGVAIFVKGKPILSDPDIFTIYDVNFSHYENKLIHLNVIIEEIKKNASFCFTPFSILHVRKIMIKIIFSVNSNSSLKKLVKIFKPMDKHVYYKFLNKCLSL
jgi:hypothetical protein